MNKKINPPPSLLQHIDAPVRAVILRGRWPQAGKYWTPDACLVRVTTRHIGWRWYYQKITGLISKKDCRDPSDSVILIALLSATPPSDNPATLASHNRQGTAADTAGGLHSLCLVRLTGGRFGSGGSGGALMWSLHGALVGFYHRVGGHFNLKHVPW